MRESGWRSLPKNMRAIDFAEGESDDGKTCGDFLRSRGVSRRIISGAKRVCGGITVNGAPVRTVDRISGGDVISLCLEDGSFIVPNGKLRAGVVYEDEHTVVFSKPSGMPVHPSAGHREDTLGNLFAYMYPELTFRPINRLDRDTTGLCAVAKNAYAAGVLSGNISKVYYAVTEGTPLPRDLGIPFFKWYCGDGEYVIDAPIGRQEGTIVRREVRADGRRAVTRYTIIKEKGGHCLLKIRLETGRTHQIRVHFSAAGHPLAGDVLYGGSGEYIGRQALHCGEMRFSRVSDGRNEEVVCPVPEDMENLVVPI